ncbi:MAG: T9SS type A sorting domain-containing protein, partial [Bacteroidales bacterium]|nr:T9SS type A sorting domain-containing protein [Bacteroidales bacterium]
LLNTACNHYIEIADKNNPDFKQCGNNILWKDWSIMGVNLNSYIGQTVYISISIANSTYGDQFGYAYVVGKCMPMAIKIDFCCYGTTPTVARFDAPEGFIAYEWKDSEGNIMGKNQKLSILGARHEAVYTVHMLSNMGCTSTLSYEIVCDSTVSDFACDSITYKCYPSKVALTALPYSRPTQIAWWVWEIFKTSENQEIEHLSMDSIFEYTFQDTGYYKILLTVYAENGCADTASAIVYSYPSYGKVNITAPDEICNHIEAEVFASGAEGYEWYNVKRITSDSSAIIDKGGTYVVRGINTLGCSMDTFIVADKIFTIQYTKENNRCPKLSDGKINITKVLGEYDGSVLHYWEDLGFTNGAALNERNNLLSDQYIVYSIDEDNCYRYDTIEITEPLPLGNIGKISGPFIVSNMATYTFSVSPVQGTELYHWYAYEIKESGRLNILDTFVNKNQMELSISDINPIEISVRAFNFCGDTTDVSSLYIQYKSDITETTDSKHIVVYPNPTSDYVTIQHKNGTLNEIRIFDVIGKEIKRQIVSGSVCTLNTENLHSGIYFIQIKTESGITTTKVYKK